MARRPPAATPAPRPRRRRLRRLLTVLLLCVLVPPAVGLIAFRWLPVPVTPLMLVRAVQGEGLDRAWIALPDVAPDVVRAVIASEDARFCRHLGFDWREIRNAWRDWRERGRLRGASTISMQTARSVFLWPGRDPVRKGLEIGLTVPLEALWPKRRILEVYLNVVEWGPGVYGIQAAARHHFGKSAGALTPTEAARLTAILPAPRSWSAAQPGSHVRQRAATIQARARTVPLGAGNAPCP